MILMGCVTSVWNRPHYIIRPTFIKIARTYLCYQFFEMWVHPTHENEDSNSVIIRKFQFVIFYTMFNLWVSHECVAVNLLDL